MNADKIKRQDAYNQRNRLFEVIYVSLCSSLATLFFTGLTFAQAYPIKPIRLLVPFPVGGGVDGVARIAFARVAEQMSQQIVIDNRGGSSGIVATELAARAPADGYTLFFGVTSALTILPHYHRKLPYDAVQDFAPINLIAAAAYILVVHPSVPAHSVKELVALAKQKPGTLNFSSAGNGTTLHLTAELFKSMAGINIVHVPYKGAAPALTDLLSGQVQMTFNPASVALPQIKSARLRGLGVTSAKRSALAPDLPTVAEAGVPGYESTGWYGVLAPSRTPASIIARLHRELTNAISDKDVRERFFATGVEPMGTTPEQFAAYMRDEYVKWGKVVKATGAKPE